MTREPVEGLRSLAEEKVEPEDSVMKGVTMRPIDTENLRTTGSFLRIGDVVFGKLLAQVEADHLKLG
jgi:energy-converting hydrogenase Eha subunit G